MTVFNEKCAHFSEDIIVTKTINNNRECILKETLYTLRTCKSVTAMIGYMQELVHGNVKKRGRAEAAAAKPDTQGLMPHFPGKTQVSLHHQ
jgi:hypothetical protein